MDGWCILSCFVLMKSHLLMQKLFGFDLVKGLVGATEGNQVIVVLLT
jgi:hypothetical protein